ncbi:transcriptional regulator [Agrobacterium cavarae]|uniref:Transcriptional regulator n=2 Tax=Agrobacterium cavarae TaxID=2528239 RepID=A0ABY1Y5B2_9HYPH|nr:transcriptional regulator [Agrobacterium cavarae]
MKGELSSSVHLSIACMDFKAVLLIAIMETNLNHHGLTATKSAASGASAIARVVGVTPQAVAQWKAVPPEYVLKLEKAFGVSRHIQRPDVFGPAEAEGR